MAKTAESLLITFGNLILIAMSGLVQLKIYKEIFEAAQQKTPSSTAFPYTEQALEKYLHHLNWGASKFYSIMFPAVDKWSKNGEKFARPEKVLWI